MLLVTLVWGVSGVEGSPAGQGLLRAIADIRTLATKCCHNLRQRRLVWVRIKALGLRHGHGRTIAVTRKTELAGRGKRRNKGFTGIYNELHDPNEHSLGSVVRW